MKSSCCEHAFPLYFVVVAPAVPAEVPGAPDAGGPDPAAAAKGSIHKAGGAMAGVGKKAKVGDAAEKVAGKPKDLIGGVLSG